VFEDVVQGIEAGRNAGMQVCAVEDPYSAWSREQKRALADYYVESFREVTAEWETPR
jgi:16S rRNA pseudouridine516 synthase